MLSLANWLSSRLAEERGNRGWRFRNEKLLVNLEKVGFGSMFECWCSGFTKKKMFFGASLNVVFLDSYRKSQHN